MNSLLSYFFKKACLSDTYNVSVAFFSEIKLILQFRFKLTEMYFVENNCVKYYAEGPLRNSSINCRPGACGCL